VGEFCTTVDATAISTTGVAMTRLQKERWHNN